MVSVIFWSAATLFTMSGCFNRLSKYFISIQSCFGIVFILVELFDDFELADFTLIFDSGVGEVFGKNDEPVRREM